ncbi:MAG: hypothetical protein COB53_00930 [Elusimicrobia bacterium]|nr:MAG: hypothetical protein COB53_00930 [Elusimicrobiota bacterium]
MTTKNLDKEALQAKFAEKFPKAEAIGEPAEGAAPTNLKGYLTMKLAASSDIIPVLRWLKDDLGFSYLDMATAIDWKGPVELDGYIREPNPNVFLPDGATPQVAQPLPHKTVNYRDAFELVYLVSNLEARLKVCLKFDIPRDGGSVETAIPVHRGADWREREIFDLFGITFTGHPNLIKILTPDFLIGHPLRKDYKHIKDRFDD